MRNPKGLWQAMRALLPDRNVCPKMPLTLGAYRAEFVTAPRYTGARFITETHCRHTELSVTNLPISMEHFIVTSSASVTRSDLP